MTAGDGLPRAECLVVGYGSIGQRHARLLQESGCTVAVFSRRPGHGRDWRGDLAGAVRDLQPDYIVLANETSEHRRSLELIAGCGYARTVLVEKPLWAAPCPALTCAARVHVGYNMRFDPVLQALRQRLAGETVIAASLRAGSYLPDWRPGRDYRTTASARRSAGGGVLRDLSHEIDYAQWLFGPIARLTAIGGHASELEIETDDSFAILAVAERCPSLSLSLDYLDRKPERWARVQTRRATFRADFRAGLLLENDDVIMDIGPQHRDAQYLALHRAVLGGDPSALCTLEEGEAVVRTIAAIEAAATGNAWVEA